MLSSSRYLTLSLLAGGAALGAAQATEPPARDGVVTMTVDWAYRPRPRVALDGKMWSCQGDRCSARLAGTAAAVERACYRMASRVGRVQRVETPSGELDEAALARCNRSRR